MGQINLATMLGFLPVVGPAVAALPEFKKLWDTLAATFDKNADQQVLKDAYATAVSGAHDANDQLQALVQQHS